MGQDCGCGHCHCDNDENNGDEASREKVEKLKKAIEELGFRVEETEEGIKIME